MKIPENTTFIDTPEQEIRIREWVDLSNHHKIEIDFVEYKLLYGENFDGNTALYYLSRSSGSQYVIRRGPNQYEFLMSKQDEQNIVPRQQFYMEIFNKSLYTITVEARSAYDRKIQQSQMIFRRRHDTLFKKSYDWICSGSHDLEHLDYKHETFGGSSYWSRSFTWTTMDEDRLLAWMGEFANKIVDVVEKDADAWNPRMKINVHVKRKKQPGEWRETDLRLELDEIRDFTPKS